jgi:membrane metallo-endopeptidase-like protein 1
MSCQVADITTEKSEECATAPCTKFSAEITEFIDDSEEPCHNFYQFVCGKFKNIAVEKQINNPLTAEQERIRNILNSFITEPHSSEDPHVVHLQKSYFQSCLNVEKNDTGLDESFFSEMDAFGGWPFLSRREWVEEEFDWVRVMNQARHTGLPFEWFLKVDLYDDSQYKLQATKLIPTLQFQ